MKKISKLTKTSTTTSSKPDPRKPVWAGPYSPQGGITQSLLAKWFCCKHRFWLYAVCGAVDAQEFNLPLCYGDAFHNALEVYALGNTTPEKAGEKIKDYFQHLLEAFPRDGYQISHWCRICYDEFLAYCKIWKNEDKQYISIAQEQSFCVPYTLPSGRVIYTRGKIDGLIGSVVEGRQGNYIVEHKIKGEVDSHNLTDTLAQNLQCMFYMPAAKTHLEKLGLPAPQGVLYDVIQRPLAGKKHSIKKKKGRKVKVKGSDKQEGGPFYEVKGAETDEQFYRRLAAIYPKHPDDFFHRWKIEISPAEIERFQKESLDPMLEQMCDWWDSIQGDLWDPWNVTVIDTNLYRNPEHHIVTNKHPNKLHMRTPFGIFNKLAKGLVGDYQEYLTTGNKDSLQRITTVFPELDT